MNQAGDGDQRFSGTLQLVGASAFAAGATLIGTSFLDASPRLWSWGVPLAIGGQFLFLLGLLFQLEILWKRNKNATSTVGASPEPPVR